jgi:hypothetical protein
MSRKRGTRKINNVARRRRNRDKIYPTNSSHGGGVGASVMRKKIELQRDERELLSKFLHDELKRMETRRLKQTQMKKSIEKRRNGKTRKRKKKGQLGKHPTLQRARSGEM